MLVSPELFPLIKDFEVVHDNGLPMHPTLRCGIAPPKGQQTRRCMNQPKSIYKALEESFEETYKEEPRAEETKEDKKDIVIKLMRRGLRKPRSNGEKLGKVIWRATKEWSMKGWRGCTKGWRQYCREAIRINTC